MIEVRDLAIALGEFRLHGISMLVEEGEYFVILGPTGAGKTVLVECIVGLHTPASGRVLLDERDVTGLRPEERQVAYVPQDYCLFPHMTVRDNIAFGMRLRHLAEQTVRDQVARLSAMLHIEGLLDRHPLTLSGGEKQRVALARALAIRPRVLLLDEPLAAVDERTRERLCDELKQVQRELGTTTIHVSHNFEETLAVADKIGIFQSGSIMQVGTPFEVFHRPRNEFVAHFTGAQNVVGGEVLATPLGAEFVSGALRLAAEGAAAGPATLVIRPEELRLHPAGSGAAPASDGLLAGTVTRVMDKGALAKVLVHAAGLEWAALLSKQEARSLGLTACMAVGVELPAASRHFICAEAEGALTG